MRKLLPLLVLVLAACSPAAPGMTDDDTAEGDASATIYVGWLFEPAADATEDLPRTDVSIVLTEEGAKDVATVPVGTYTGNGSDDIATQPPAGAVTMAGTWWAGAGDEFVVSRPEPATLVVRHRWVDAESETGFGEYEEVLKVAIDPAARVVAAE